MPNLAKIIAEHTYVHHVSWFACRCGAECNSLQGWAAHVAMMITNALTIRTVEQLDALPPHGTDYSGTLIKASMFGCIYELNEDGTWTDLDERKTVAAEDIPLPATLLWTPGVDA